MRQNHLGRGFALQAICGPQHGDGGAGSKLKSLPVMLQLSVNSSVFLLYLFLVLLYLLSLVLYLF
jgi:hypothetical protein